MVVIFQRIWNQLWHSKVSIRISNVIFRLIFISRLSTLCSVNRVDADLFVILLKSCKILSSFRELSLLHTLSNIPVDEGTLGVHEVKLVVKSGPGLGDGGGVGQHTDSSLYLGKITSRYNSWRLIVDTNLESSGTPVNKLNTSLGLDGSNSSIDILGNYITSVQKTAGHVLTMTRITLHHLVGRLKAGVGDLTNSKLLMISLVRRDDRGIGDQRKVNPGIGHQVSL